MAMSRARYGVFREGDGISDRAVFLVDKQGRVAWMKTYAIPEQPPMAELLSAMAAIESRAVAAPRSARVRGSGAGHRGPRKRQSRGLGQSPI